MFMMQQKLHTFTILAVHTMCHYSDVTESDNQTCVDITYSASGQCVMYTCMSPWLLLMYHNSCPYNVIPTPSLTIPVDIYLGIV